MRGSGRLITVGLVFTLCAAAGNASAAAREPGSGEAFASPAAPAAPAPPAVPAKTRKGDDTSWGVLLRGGYFGVPDVIVDELFVQHPEVSGSSIGAEIRYHGEGGGRGSTSIGLAIDSAQAEADGIWQKDASVSPEQVSGEVSMLAITLTGYWSLFPSWYVHPYAGIGIGVAHATGHYLDKNERVDADYWLPVVHIPIGLAVELGKHLQLNVEGRFIDGIALGGALQVRF